MKYMVTWSLDTTPEEVDAENERDLIINIAKNDGSYCDLFKKSLAGLEDLKDMVALHDVFAYSAIEDIYVIADHVYTNGGNGNG